MDCKKYIWLLVDASAALIDQALDMFMLYEYAVNNEWNFFWVGLGTIVVPSLVIGIFGILEGMHFSGHEKVVQYANFLPGINILANAARLMRAFLGERYEGRDPDWVERWYEKYEDQYIFARYMEAILEAGPQTVLQAFVALRRPEGIHAGVLYTSMGFSIFSIVKTLVTTVVLKRTSLSYPEKVRMFLLAMSYELCEVISRVFSVALLWYFCGGYLTATFLAGEYGIIFVILMARGMCKSCGSCNTYETCSYGMQNTFVFMIWPLFLQFTSFMCSKEFPFWMFLLLRLLLLTAYGAVSFTFKSDDVDVTGRSALFFWIVVITNTLWVLLMPAFVNSCQNLDISLENILLGQIEVQTLTPSDCHYPFEIFKDYGDNRSIFSCIYKKKAAEVASGATDIADIMAGAGAG